MLFNFKKQTLSQSKINQSGKILAVQSGRVISITDVKDEVFSKKILGDGVAIQPESGNIVSPVSGKIITIADTFHAYGLKTEDGLEILIHIGIDTVDLNGKGFQNHVRLNEQVTVGTPLCSVDLPFLRQNGYETDIIVLVTNLPQWFAPIIKHDGVTAQIGQTCIIEYCRKK